MKKVEEGDLFPRGSGPNATPRIKKRSGEVLFAPESKRGRPTREITDEDASPSSNASVTKYGSSLTMKRVAVGMNVLAVVVRSTETVVELALPSGNRAVALDETLLEDEQLAKIQAPAFQTSRDDGNIDKMQDDGDSDSSDDEDEDKEMKDSDSDDQTAAHDSEEDDHDADGSSNGKVQPLWKVLRVGQLLPVSIVSMPTDEVKLFTVSLKPHLVNVALNPSLLLTKNFPAYATIMSIEDHGYVLSFGSNISYTGFLPFNKCDPHDKNSRMLVGTPVQVLTETNVAVPKKKRNTSVAIRVRAQKNEVKKFAVDVLESASFQDIRPGMLLRARVMEEGPGGLSLLSLGVFPVAVDDTHIPYDIDGNRTVTKGKQVSARVLYVDATTKLIGASLLDCLVSDYSAPVLPRGWSKGTLLNPLRVQTVRNGYGLSLRFVIEDGDDAMGEEDEDPETWKAIPIFSHIKMVSDSKINVLESKFSNGTIIKKGGRIISRSRLDGTVFVDLRESVLDRKALSIDDIEVGATYDCKVSKHNDKGILVAVEGDSKLTGLITKLHISDVSLSEKKLLKHESFQVGSSVKCIVLSINKGHKKIYLSSRKSLLNPRYPILTSLEDVDSKLNSTKEDSEDEDGSNEGASPVVYSGNVVKITDKGNLLVSFSNHISGLVLRSDLALDLSNRSGPPSTEEIELMYPIGQTVATRVVSVSPNEQKLQLSMNLDAPILKPGDFASGTITGVNEDLGHFIVSAGEKQNSPDAKAKSIRKIQCLLPFQHLCDAPEFASRLANELSKQLSQPSESKETKKTKKKQKSIPIQSSLVIANRDGAVILSLKESMKHGVKDGSTPSSFQQIVEKTNKSSASDSKKMVLFGYVKSILPNGAIIGFLGDIVGFVKGAMVTDHLAGDMSNILKVNQSIAAIVLKVDQEKARLSLSTRPRDVGAIATERYSLSTFGCYKQWSSFVQKEHVEDEISIGSVIQGMITSIHDHGVEYALKTSKETVPGVEVDLTEEKTSAEKEKLKVGQKKKVCVLDIDPITGIVDLTQDKDIISMQSSKKALKTKKSYEAKVILTKKTHAVLLVKSSKASSLAYSLINPLSSPFENIHAGSSVQCEVLQKLDEDFSRNIVRIDTISKKEDAEKEMSKDSKPNSDAEDKENQMDNLTVLKDAFEQDPNSIIGMKVKGRITKQEPTYAFLSIGAGVVGHLHITNTGKLEEQDLKDVPLGPLPEGLASKLSIPKKGTVLNSLLVMGVRKKGDQLGSGPMVLELASTDCVPERPDLKVGDSFVGVVATVPLADKKEEVQNEQNKRMSFVSVAIDQSTRVMCHDVDCISAGGSNNGILDKTMKVGMPVKCSIINVKPNGFLQGALSNNGKSGIDNEFFDGIVTDISKATGLRVAIPWFARNKNSKGLSWGSVELCDLATDFLVAWKVLSSAKIGALVKVRNVSKADDKSSGNKHILLSMRNKDKETKNCKDAIIDEQNLGKLEEGDKVRGFVKSTTSKGCFISIGRNVVGHVKLSNLSDTFIKSPEKKFPTGRVVKCIIERINVDPNNKEGLRLELKLKPDKKDQKLEDTTLKVQDVKEGDVLKGVISKIVKFGFIVKASKTVRTMLHKREIGIPVEDPTKQLSVGQPFYVVVIEVQGQGKFKVGSKKEYFEEAGLSETEVAEVLNNNKSSVEGATEGINSSTSIDLADGYGLYRRKASKKDEDENNVMTDSDDSAENTDDDESEEEEEELSEDEAQTNQAGTDVDMIEENEGNVAPLKVGRNFVFSAINPKLDEDDGEGDDNDDDDDEYGDTNIMDKKQSSKQKREKKRKKEAQEAETRLREEALGRNDQIPETAEDFERLLIGKPDSSVLWIQYMAFCVGLSQVDKARAIAERALETIDVTNERERLNVWVAYINLEARFSNMNAMDVESNDKSLSLRREAAVLRIFERACQRVTDVEGFYLQVAKALLMGDMESNNNGDGDGGIGRAILKRATKKFKGNEKIWIAYGESYFKRGEFKGGRECLERALKSVDKRAHGRLICKFGQLEYKYGSAERGRTVFESLIGNLGEKKGVDVWNIYLDMEIGQCKKEADEHVDDEDKIEESVKRTRGLFERFVAMDLSSKKMKFGFKKWLNFEKRFGSKEDQRAVKSRAREYVERIKMD